MLGVAVMLTTMGLAQTARYQVTDAFDTNANRRVSMFVSGDNTKEAVKKLIADSGQETINRIQGVPGVEAAVLLTEYPDIEVKTRPNDEPREARFYGVFPTELSPALFDIDRHGMAEHKLAENEVLVGKDFARALDLGPMIAAPTIWLQGQPFTVVGEVINSGMRSEIPNGVIVSEKAASAMAVPSSVGIELRTQPGAAQQVAQYAPLAWNATYIDDISVYAPPNPNDMRDTIDQSVNTVLMTLTLVSALAALLTLTNSMATGVQRRTGEFGMRRAIGCQKSHLAGLVAAESTIIGAIGGIIGTVIAILTILVVTMFQRWQPVMDFSLVPYGIVGGVLVGVLGSLLAIYRAVRITPAEALRSH
jgi:ABC-type transport system, involved in lipoprotein release, permease component